MRSCNYVHMSRASNFSMQAIDGSHELHDSRCIIDISYEIV